MAEPERRVTRIERQKRRADRVNVYLDGEFAFGLPATVAIDFQMRSGRVLSATEVAELQELDESAKAFDSALRLLAVRPRSTREIQLRLRQKDVDDETIERIVRRLHELKYLDDSEFARTWVENRETNRPRGRRLLEHELRAKGVARETVAQAIGEAEIDELAGALEIARDKLRSYRDLDEQAAKRRLGAFLARRGYDYSVIKPVLAQLIGGADDDDEEPE